MKKPYILLIILILLAIVALGITVFHTTAHCFYKGNGVSATGCDDDLKDNCPYAYAVSGDVLGVSANVFCPWSMKSYITGYVGTGLTILFSVIICFIRREESPRNLIFTLAGLIVGSLLAACGCMAYDIKKAWDIYDADDGSSGYSKQPITYIVNGAINLVLVFVVIWTAFKSKGDGSTPGNSRSVQAFGY